METEEIREVDLSCKDSYLGLGKDREGISDDKDIFSDSQHMVDDIRGSLPLNYEDPIQETTDILLNADNTSQEPIIRVDNDNEFRRSRPETQVFSQGKIYTYDKLDPLESSVAKKDKRKKESRVKSMEATAVQKETETGSNTANNSLLNIKSKDVISALKEIRIKNLKNVIIGQLNINSLRKKFYALEELMGGNLDILVITETKLDHTFPEKQFLIPGYKKPYRRDRNKHGGGVMIYVREDIPSDILLKHKIRENIEAIFLEINLRKTKLLLGGTYHSTHETYGAKDEEYFQQMGLVLDVYSSYDKFLLAGDFNVREGDDTLDEFMEEYHAKNLVKEPTCFKNSENPSCIDLFITNSCLSFQNTTTLCSGLSDFHKMTVTVLKTTFPKAKPRVITYRTQYQTLDLENALLENLGNKVENNYENFDDTVTASHNSVSKKEYRSARTIEKL